VYRPFANLSEVVHNVTGATYTFVMAVSPRVLSFGEEVMLQSPWTDRQRLQVQSIFDLPVAQNSQDGGIPVDQIRSIHFDLVDLMKRESKMQNVIKVCFNAEWDRTLARIQASGANPGPWAYKDSASFLAGFDHSKLEKKCSSGAASLCQRFEQDLRDQANAHRSSDEVVIQPRQVLKISGPGVSIFAMLCLVMVCFRRSLANTARRCCLAAPPRPQSQYELDERGPSSRSQRGSQASQSVPPSGSTRKTKKDEPQKNPPQASVLVPGVIYGVGGDKDMCCICISNLETGDDVAVLPCQSHLLHWQCWEKWSERNPMCPMCRKQVPPTEVFCRSWRRFPEWMLDGDGKPIVNLENFDIEPNASSTSEATADQIRSKRPACARPHSSARRTSIRQASASSTPAASPRAASPQPAMSPSASATSVGLHSVSSTAASPVAEISTAGSADVVRTNVAAPSLVESANRASQRTRPALSHGANSTRVGSRSVSSVAASPVTTTDGADAVNRIAPSSVESENRTSQQTRPASSRTASSTRAGSHSVSSAATPVATTEGADALSAVEPSSVESENRTSQRTRPASSRTASSTRANAVSTVAPSSVESENRTSQRDRPALSRSASSARVGSHSVSTVAASTVAEVSTAGGASAVSTAMATSSSVEDSRASQRTRMRPQRRFSQGTSASNGDASVESRTPRFETAHRHASSPDSAPVSRNGEGGSQVSRQDTSRTPARRRTNGSSRAQSSPNQGESETSFSQIVVTV